MPIPTPVSTKNMELYKIQLEQKLNNSVGGSNYNYGK